MPSKFGGVPVEEQASGSKYGGVPMDAAPASAPAPAATPTEKPSRGFLGSLWDATGGPLVQTVKDVGQALAPPSEESNAARDRLVAIPAGIARQFNDSLSGAGRSLVHGDVPGLAYHAAGLVPGLGPTFQQGSNELASGDVGSGLGTIAGGVTSAFAPKILPKAGNLVRSGAEATAETALGTRAIGRAYNKTPGAAALDETTGVRPGTVEASAQKRIGQLMPEIQQGYQNAVPEASMQPARTVLNSEDANLRSQNARKSVAQLQPMLEHVNDDMRTGKPIPDLVHAEDLWRLKQGFGKEFIHNWNPETMKGTKSTAAQTYGAMDKELDRVAPENASRNQLVSSLIPVADSAAIKEAQASPLQRMAGRVSAHTGALVGAGLGFQHGGPAGGLAGLAIPELIASPTAQMAAARGLNNFSRTLKAPFAGRAFQAAPLVRTYEPEEN